MLQLKVKVININLPEHHPLLEKCRSLYEYSWFIQRIREYLGQNKSRDASIALAMEDCVKEGLLVDFIREHGSEVRNMLFGEFNLEVAKEVWEEEAREDGMEKGLREGRERGLQEGREEGERKKLIQQVCRKLQKDKTPETIADELEEDYALIQKICRAVEETGASYDCDQIYDRIKKADS